MKFTMRTELPRDYYEPTLIKFSDFLFGDISITGNMNNNSLCIICAIFKDGYRYTLNLSFRNDKLRKVYFNVTRLDSGYIFNLMAIEESLDDLLSYIYSNYILAKNLDIDKEETNND
jgi:hypothetical protein|nr:MAG TPA: hypothetical protein [Caudoviricetes sp.]